MCSVDVILCITMGMMEYEQIFRKGLEIIPQQDSWMARGLYG